MNVYLPLVNFIPIMKILSSFTHPLVVSDLIDFGSSLKHKLRYFYKKLSEFCPSIESPFNQNFQASKSS